MPRLCTDLDLKLAKLESFRSLAARFTRSETPIFKIFPNRKVTNVTIVSFSKLFSRSKTPFFYLKLGLSFVIAFDILIFSHMFTVKSGDIFERNFQLPKNCKQYVIIETLHAA